MIGSIKGVVKGDARSSDYTSYCCGHDCGNDANHGNIFCRQDGGWEVFSRDVIAPIQTKTISSFWLSYFERRI